MKKLFVCFGIQGLFLLTLFVRPSFSQRAWKYTYITGTESSSKSSPLATTSSTVQSTPSNYPNITLHPNANVDQSEMSIVTYGDHILVGDNTVIQNVSPVESNQGYYYSTNRGINWSGNDILNNTINTNTTFLSDPEVVYDLSGHAFFSYLRVRFHQNSRGQNVVDSSSVMIKKSTDGGVS